MKGRPLAAPLFWFALLTAGLSKPGPPQLQGAPFIAVLCDEWDIRAEARTALFTIFLQIPRRSYLTAGLSTSLRFGRDDDVVVDRKESRSLPHSTSLRVRDDKI